MFGQRLKTIRNEKGLTQKRLAELLEVTQQTVGKWEVDSCAPSNEMLIKISRFFEVSTDWLLGVSDSRSESNPDDLDLRFALFGTADISDELLEEVRRYAQLKIAQLRYEEAVEQSKSDKLGE